MLAVLLSAFPRVSAGSAVKCLFREDRKHVALSIVSSRNSATGSLYGKLYLYLLSPSCSLIKCNEGALIITLPWQKHMCVQPDKDNQDTHR